MKLAAPSCLVMHPGPMNEGVEIMPDVAVSAQSVIEEQVTNGVAVRMAVLFMLASADGRGRGRGPRPAEEGGVGAPPGSGEAAREQ
jgi:hypothetical protein